MHIPDGYISPATALAFYGAVLPFWWTAAQRLKRILTGQLVPALALFSAFTFAIMMFNVPVPGGVPTMSRPGPRPRGATAAASGGRSSGPRGTSAGSPQPGE